MTKYTIFLTLFVSTLGLYSMEVIASGSYGGGASQGATNSSSNGVLKNKSAKNLRERARQEAKQNLKKVEFTKFDFSHADFTSVIAPHIEYNINQTASKLDYSSVNKKSLDSYVDNLLNVPKKQFDSWNNDHQLAFLINTYNALTIKRIIEKMPKDSIKELGSGFPLYRSPWKIDFFEIFEKKANLDHIEHELARGSGRYNDPRIHFAFNCASIGCPALQKVPFDGDRLDQQLDQATEQFLRDRNRNYFDKEKNSLLVSSIFKWYRGDFEKGDKGFHSLKDFFSSYASSLTDDPEVMALIKKKSDYSIEFLDYDWKLNNQF